MQIARFTGSRVHLETQFVSLSYSLVCCKHSLHTDSMYDNRLYITDIREEVHICTALMHRTL